jgi:hypothetical protein
MERAVRDDVQFAPQHRPETGAARPGRYRADFAVHSA